MSKREDEDYASWVEDVGKTLPAEKQEAWKALADLDVTRERFYRGSLRSEDYYTRLNELKAEKDKTEKLKTELYAWYEEQAPKNEALLAERDLLRAQLEEAGTDDPPNKVSGVSAEQFAELKAKADKVEQLDRIMPNVLADMAAVVRDSIKNDYDIDPREVVRVSLQQGVPPWKAYELMTAEQRAKKYEEAHEAERKKWIDEGKRQAISASTGSPDHIRPSGPSVVDFLQRKEQDESTQSSRVRSALLELEQGNY